MKKYFITAAALLAFILIASREPVRPAESVRLAYLADCAKFTAAVQKLKSTAAKLPLSTQQLQSDFKAARLAYKRVAWLLGYLDAEGEKEMNGAPLPKVELIHFSEIPPTGFQPIEEIVFAENPADEQPKLVELTQTLSLHAQLWQQRVAEQPLSDREVFEALRVELVQMFTLSLAGFDSPVAIHALPEAEVAWDALFDAFVFYEKNLRNIDPSVVRAISESFTRGKLFFAQNRDFNAFDRAAFFKECVQPTYQLLQRAQGRLGIENYQLTSGLRRSWSDTASAIFSRYFLDAKFFSHIKEKNFEDAPERIELGRLLFFDPILSSNGQRSCASCHRPENALAETRTTSLDLAGKPLERNAPSLVYSALATSQFWDGRARDVEEQLFHVASNLREMGNQIEDVPVRLQKSAAYVALFDRAFPNQPDALRVSNVQKAIGAYLRSLAVFDSDFDRYMGGERGNIEPAAKRGFNLFMGKAKCGTCHFAPVFNGTVPPQYFDTEFEVLGVLDEKGNLDADLGRYALYPAEKFRRAFKTVTVRNAAISAPYMHNGAQKTLDEVVDFYNKGGGNGLGHPVDNQTLPFDKLSLTKREKSDIVRFLHALTDRSLPQAPSQLPLFGVPDLDKRPVGGSY